MSLSFKQDEVNSVTGKAVLTRSPMLWFKGSSDSDIVNFPLLENPGTVLSVPIIEPNGKMVGAFVLEWISMYTYSLQDLPLFQAIASQIPTALRITELIKQRATPAQLAVASPISELDKSRFALSNLKHYFAHTFHLIRNLSGFWVEIAETSTEWGWSDALAMRLSDDAGTVKVLVDNAERETLLFQQCLEPPKVESIKVLDVRTLLEEQLKQAHKQKCVKVQFDIGNGIIVSSSEAQIQRILMLITQNAFEAAEAAPIPTVIARRDDIHVDSSDVQLSILNNGDELHQEALEAFDRGEFIPSTKERDSGLNSPIRGKGLYLVRNFAQRIGAVVSFSKEIVNGETFTACSIRIPENIPPSCLNCP